MVFLLGVISVILLFWFLFKTLLKLWRRKTYRKLLRKPQWKRKRNKILDRDGHRCQYCGRRTNLQVHHKYYEKYPDNTFVEPWNYPDSALITLCETCHKSAHTRKKVNTYYRKFGK